MFKKNARSWTAFGLAATVLPLAAIASEEALDGELELDEVVVTGSRITRTGPETPNPILSLDRQGLDASGLNNLTDYLVTVPALIGSTTTSDTSGFGFGIGRVGLNLLDLRNLGTDRTLVLVSGRRHIAGDIGSSAVDVNSIPVDLIERVDVLTGGMSAIYGADGVSGVVNFVTKRNFEGLRFRAQSGLSEQGDSGSDLFSVTAGRNFAGGAGNVALAYEFSQDDRVRSSARARVGDSLQTYDFARNPLDDPDNDDPDLYDLVVVNDLRWLDSSPDGAIDADGDLVPDFRGAGQAYDVGEVYGGVARGGSSTPIAGYDGDLRAKTRRHVVNLLGSYEASDALRLFAEGKFVRSQAWNTGQPTFGFYNFIGADNPLIPQQIRDGMVPGAIPFWFDEYLGETVGDGVFMTRDHMDFPRRGDKATRETLRSVVGVDGSLSDSVRYEASYTYGQADVEYFGTNNRIEDRFFAALDVVDEGEFLGGTPNGVYRCRIDLQPAGTVISPENILADMLFGGGYAPGGDGSGVPQTFTPGDDSGCLPLNLFGDGVADPAALAWMHADARTRSRMRHHVVSGHLSGDLGSVFELPGGAVGWAAGAEYRKEYSRSTPDEMIQQELLTGYPRIDPERGSFDVTEAFAEVNLPLLRDAPFAHRLSVGGAVRFADYSTIGAATTWKADTVWAPVPDIALRGTWSQAVRAPNIAELYSPLSGTYESITDPCDITQLTLGPSPGNRQANCTSLLTALGIDPTTFEPSESAVASGSVLGQLGGNPELSEETARSWTAGFVFTPRFTPGLSVSFDWYDIRLKSAVSYVSADELVALCVDAPSLDNVFCESITRNAATGFIDGFELRPQNVSRFTTAGADLVIDYAFTLNPDWGRFSLQLAGGYLDELTFISTPGADVVSNRNDPYMPKYSASSDLTWSRGAWDVNFGTSYFSKTRRFDAETMAAEPDYVDPRYVWYKASWVNDLQVAYSLRDKGVRIYGGANNLFDVGPDFPSGSYPNGWLGRYFYAGVNFDLGAR